MKFPIRQFLFGVMILALNDVTAQCDSTIFRYASTFINDATVFADTNKIIGVGDNGYIIKSTDGGRSWRNITSFTPFYLRAIHAPTDSILYTVGSWKTVLKSEDQGESWYPLSVRTTNNSLLNESSFFNDVFFLNKDKGFIVGDYGFVATTLDGGRSWKDTTLYASLSSRLNSITFVDDSLGFISGGSNSLFRTKNGGSTWEKIDVDFIGFNISIEQVTFLNALTGFAVGDYGLVLKTTDGGTTWARINAPNGGTNYDICFTNAQTGFIAGNYNYKTIDGGNTWTPQLDNPFLSYAVATDPAGKKVIFSGGGTMLGYNGRTLVGTIDNGASYQQLSANRSIDNSEIFFLNDSTGYMASNNQVYKTSDYAESWKPLQWVPALLNNPVKSIFFLDEQNGYAATDRIYKTNDGGNSWNLTTIPGGQQQYFPNRMHFFDPLQGLVMDFGSIYRTLDGGSSWSPVYTLAPRLMLDFCFTNNGNGFAVGFGGNALVSPDKGATWSSLNLNTNSDLSAVHFYNNNLGFIGTTDSTLYKTTDGGVTWIKVNTGIHLAMRSLKFVNETTGYLLVGNYGSGLTSIYKTKDGGASWFFLNQQANGGNLTRLTGKVNVYSAGGQGLVVKTDSLRAPGIAGYIYGPPVNCQNSSSIFNTGPSQGLNYNWTLSGGGTQKFKANLDTVSWSTPGTYTIAVSRSNVCGTGATRQITVPVNAITEIINPPAPKTVCPGSGVTFSVDAGGSELSYQWKKDYQNINGAISNTFTLPNVVAADSGYYSVVVSGLCGQLMSAQAKLRVLPSDYCLTPVSSLNMYISSATLMPNQVRDNTILKVIARQTAHADWTILNASGKAVMRFSSQLFYGENKFNLSLQHLPAGIYYMRGTIANANGQSLKFIKL